MNNRADSVPSGSGERTSHGSVRGFHKQRQTAARVSRDVSHLKMRRNLRCRVSCRRPRVLRQDAQLGRVGQPAADCGVRGRRRRV